MFKYTIYGILLYQRRTITIIGDERKTIVGKSQSIIYLYNDEIVYNIKYTNDTHAIKMLYVRASGPFTLHWLRAAKKNWSKGLVTATTIRAISS